jgi:hypothetical protein
MAALGVDKFACRGYWKSDNRGNWNWFYGRGCQVATSITGGVAALGMSMYGDLLDNDVCRRNVEKCGYEEGLKPWKLFL